MDNILIKLPPSVEQTLEAARGHTVILVRDYWGSQSDSIVGNLSGYTNRLYQVQSVGISSVFNVSDVETLTEPREDQRRDGIVLIIWLKRFVLPQVQPSLVKRFLKWAF